MRCVIVLWRAGGAAIDHAFHAQTAAKALGVARQKNKKLTVDSAGDGVVLMGEAPADWSVRPGRGTSTL